MRTLLRAAGTALAVLAMVGAALADEVDAGRVKARACAVCHGPLGLAVAPDTPNLAGQPASYLVAQLRAYRSGARRHDIMSLMAKPLADGDIDEIAAWFAAVKVEATSAR